MSLQFLHDSFPNKPVAPQIIYDLPFSEYARLPGINASILKEPTPFESLCKLQASVSLPPEAQRLLEYKDARVSDYMEWVDELTGSDVPRTFVKLVRYPEGKEKATDAQKRLLESFKTEGQVIDAREFNVAALGKCTDFGWVTTFEKEVRESRASPEVTANRAYNLTVGDIVHKAILEPHLFDQDEWQKHFQKSPTKSLVSERAMAALAEAPHLRLVTAEIIDTARRCRDAVWRHKYAALILSAPGKSEVTVTAYDAEAMCLRKCRIDRLPDNPELGIIDIKTHHSSPTEGSCKKAILAMQYHLQMGYYADTLAMAEGKTRTPSVLIFVSKTAPHIARCIDINKVEPELSLFEDGRKIATNRLMKFALCYAEGQRFEAYENEATVPLAK